jgi:hypothetical protein
VEVEDNLKGTFLLVPMSNRHQTISRVNLVEELTAITTLTKVAKGVEGRDV